LGHLGLSRDDLYLYSPSNIIRVIKSRRVIWVEHVARMGDRRGAFMVLARRPDGKKFTWKT